MRTLLPQHVGIQRKRAGVADGWETHTPRLYIKEKSSENTSLFKDQQKLLEHTIKQFSFSITMNV